MTALVLIGLFVLGPVAMFLVWFRALTKRWLLIWFGLGGVICGAFLMAGLNAPPMDWGYTLTTATLWTVFWALGGFLQLLRLLDRRSKP